MGIKIRFDRAILSVLICLLTGQVARAATVPSETDSIARQKIETERGVLFDKLYGKALNINEESNEDNSVRINHLWMAYMADSTQTSVLHDLALAYASMRKPAETLKMMHAAFKHSEGDKEIGERLIDLSSRLQQWGIARETLLALLERNPGDKSLLRQLVDIYAGSGDSENAIATIDKLMQMDKSLSILLYQKAVLYAEMGKEEEAVSLLERHLADNPADIQSAVGLVSMYMNTGQTGKARALIDSFQKKFPNDLDLKELRVNVCTALKDYDCAVSMIRDISRTEGIMPEQIQLLITNTIDRSESKPEMQSALTPLLTDLVRDYPLSHYFSLSLANNHLIAGDSTRAEEIFKGFIDNGVEEEAPYIYFVNKYAKLEDKSKILEVTRKARQIFPERGIFYLYEILSLYNQEDRTPLVPVLDEALTRVPKKDIYYGALVLMKADLEQEGGNLERSRPYYEEAIVYTNDPTAYNNYAYALATHGTAEDLNKAEGLASKAVKMQGNNPSFLDTYAWILYLKGEYTLAKLYMENAISNSDTPSDTLYEHYAEILTRLGDKDAAIKAWEKYAELSGEQKRATAKINELKK